MNFATQCGIAALLVSTASATLSEYDQLTACFAPITTAFAGNGASSNTLVPEASDWQPQFENQFATNVDLSNPHIAMADALGNVYIADKASHSILQVTTDGRIHTFAGTHAFPYTGPPPAYTPPPGFVDDGPGPAIGLNLVACNGLYVLPNGVVYVYDAGSHRIRRVGLDGIMTTVINDPDGEILPGDDASRRYLPSGRGLWVSQNEDLIYYTHEVPDYSRPIPLGVSISHPPFGGVVKKWTPTGGIKAITAFPAVPTSSNLEFINPGNIDVNPVDHKLYVTDRAENAPAGNTHSVVYRIDEEAADPATGASTKTVVAGNYYATGGGVIEGQPATSAYLFQVRGISFLPNGAYFLCTHKGGQVLYVDTDGNIHLFMNGNGKGDKNFYNSTLPLSLPLVFGLAQNQPRSVSVTPDGSLLVVSNDGGRVRKVQNICPPEMPTIQSVEIAGAPQQFHFTWDSTPGRSYLVESSSDMSADSWEVTKIVTADQASADYAEPFDQGNPHRFFRLSSPR